MPKKCQASHQDIAKLTIWCDKNRERINGKPSVDVIEMAFRDIQYRFSAYAVRNVMKGLGLTIYHSNNENGRPSSDHLKSRITALEQRVAKLEELWQ